MVYEIVHSQLPPTDKSFDRIMEEVATVTDAGFESTANVLRLILYHVYTNVEILQRLRNKIASAKASASSESDKTTESSTPIALKSLEQLPYLTAVLMEGMRLSPAIATRAARITNKDLMYGGWRIPSGTPVGMTTLLMHTDEKLYPDPMRFDPDHWMDPAFAANAKFAPFSRGTRICLGMHLAWAEMYLIISALVQHFSFTIENATATDFEMERDNFGIGTKAGCNLVAAVAANT
ncbi:putative Trichodiene oxygenase [Hypoxylon sp. NC1633]|nr:putative Trichodiene oxygenase [Hypoxylon sp. NC1633]